MGIEPETPGLTVVAALALALDRDDFDAVVGYLHPDVVYEIGGVSHRGAAAVVESYRSGSALARRIFDDVQFDHCLVGPVGDRTIRVDFSDRLTAGGEQFEHHSIQDITVDVADRVTHIVDRHVEGQRGRLDEFMSRHRRVRP
jgi:hypothetical protein